MPCMRCKGEHELVACAFVKAVEFVEGEISRVEFLTPVDCHPAPIQTPAADTGGDYPKLGSRHA